MSILYIAFSKLYLIVLLFSLYIIWKSEIHLVFFYNQPVYKQLALGWQIAKQLLGLNPISINNNKTIDKEKWSFSFAINVKKF